MQLRLKLQGADADSSSGEKDTTYITRQLEGMVQEGASEVDIQQVLKELGDKFGDYGRDRRSTINFHLKQLRRCLQPTQTTRAIVFLMSCAISFHRPNGDVISGQEGEFASLWYYMLDTINPDAEQRKQMFSFAIPSATQTDVLQELYRASDSCDGLLNRLESIICDKNNAFDQEFDNIKTIMSSRQTAKFILWIYQNPACMQMLEQLWPHLTGNVRNSYGGDEDTTIKNSFASSGGIISSSATSSAVMDSSVGTKRGIKKDDPREDDDFSGDDSAHSSDESLGNS